MLEDQDREDLNALQAEQKYKRSDYHRKYYQKNRQKIDERHKEYYRANKERISQYRKKKRAAIKKLLENPLKWNS